MNALAAAIDRLAAWKTRAEFAGAARANCGPPGAIGPTLAGREAAELALTSRIFWLLTLVHVLVWSILPTLLQPNRPLDMVEMLYWGHGWQWGYSKHPPLPAWIAEAVFQLSGGRLWPLYLVPQVLVATSMWAAWQLARQFMRPWPALCAAALLETSVYYNLTTADINHSIVLQPLWALSALGLYRALVTGRLRYWAATGVALGLGMLAKYDLAILVVSLLALATFNRRARAALRTPGPYVTLLVSLAIFAPHLAWMVNNEFGTIDYVFARSENRRQWLGHVVNPLEFLLSQLLALAPMLLLTYPLRREARDERSPVEHAAPDADHLRRDFLLAVCGGPLVIDLGISLVTGLNMQSMWGVPMWSFAGLLLVYHAGPVRDTAAYRRLLVRALVVGGILILGFVGRTTVLPHWRGKASRIHFPGAPLARAVSDAWQQHTDQPLTLVTGTWWPAANVAINLPSRAQAYDFVEPENSPWSNDEALRATGGVVLWEADEDDLGVADELRSRFPDAEILPPVEIRWQTRAPLAPARFHLAIVLPPGARESNAQARRANRAGGIEQAARSDRQPRLH